MRSQLASQPANEEPALFVHIFFLEICPYIFLKICPYIFLQPILKPILQPIVNQLSTNCQSMSQAIVNQLSTT